MNYEKLEQLEKYFKDRFNEPMFRVTENIKAAQFMINLDEKIVSEDQQKDGYILTTPKRNTSIFQKKCKQCKKSVLKNIDLSTYYKHNYCYECFVLNGEK